MSLVRLTLASLFVVVGVLSTSTDASAYSYDGGDFTLKVNAGAGVNFVHLDVATKRTPPAGMQLSLDADYAIQAPLHVVASLRPSYSGNFIDTGIGAGIAYRVVQLKAPFVPYVSGMVTTAVGVPFTHGDWHLNIGARVAAGVEYFVMRHLLVSLEVANEGSLLAFPLLYPEVTAEVLLGVGWRF